MRQHFEEVLTKLEQLGLLLVSGNEIPDVRRVVSGTDSKGSWWADPAAHSIFAVNELLEDHPDVLIAKLVSGKVTFVHRKLWSQVYAVATAKSDWQTTALTKAASALLVQIEHDGTLLTNQLVAKAGDKPGVLARELELRLLVHAEQVHTASGAHAKMLETWNHWAKRIKFKPKAIKSADAQVFLEQRLEKINEEFAGAGTLPWARKLRKRAR